ncbi:hypothetical protein [Dactylosporangium sp. CA-233914]|uniref:hypothetical protein n=1 Tax=Dactylosporangium sp. CA-233914 TaxID=3239934 RepID=UPI003D92046C
MAVAAAVVIVLVAAGGAVAWWALHPDPRAVAKDYFARLAVGDAFGALRDIDKSSLAAELPTADPLLADAALTDPASRPQGMTITHVAQAGDTATMTVQYQAHGTPVTQTLKAQRRGRGYELQFPLVKLSFANLSGADKTKVTVNGVPVDPSKNGPAFPGAYAVTTAANALFDGRSVTAVPAPDAVATVTLPAPSMSADARTKAEAAINAALRTCYGDGPRQLLAVGNATGFTSCPRQAGPWASIDVFEDFPPAAIKAMASMTTMIATSGAELAITRLPAYTYTVGPADEVMFTGTDAVVHWVVVVSLSDGRKYNGKSGDTTIQPKGRVGLDATGQIQVTFT